MYKQAIVVRADLKLSKGKACAQVAHASVSAFLMTKRNIRNRWLKDNQKKVVLKVRDLEELKELRELSRKNDVPSALITDAGYTEIPPGTITALGIGPADEGQIDRVTAHLKLL